MADASHEKKYVDEEKYKIQTSVGKFRVDKTKTHLRVGGKKFCVEIKLYDSDTPEFAELQWLITKDGGCELNDALIKGESTVHLLKLSLTLLKLYRNVQFINLLDNSKYDCEFADKTKKTIFINKYNYLFHGATWYDEKVGAVPIDSALKELYNEAKPLYTEPSAKHSSFDFRNKVLQMELAPLYEATRTWKEFADILHEKYDNQTLCQKISPWYDYAVATLTKDRMLPEFWKIDITDINIPFTQVIEGGGKKRITRKIQYSVPNEEYFTISPSELYHKKL